MSDKLFGRNYTIILVGQIISLIGNAILSFALPLHLLKLTGSGAIFGSVMAISIIPMILLSPIGGIIADRVNRRNIMVALDFITCGVMVLTTLSINSAPIPIVCIVLVMLSIVRTFYQPAVQSSIPTVVSGKNLLRGNSFVNMVNALSLMVGPILGGVMYSAWGIMPIIAVSAAAFFISAVMEIFINMPFVKRPLEQSVMGTIRSDFGESLRFMVKDNPIIFKTMLIVAGLNLVLTSLIMIGIPYIVNITLAMDSAAYGVTQSALGLGSLAGGLIMGVFAQKITHKRYHLLLLGASVAMIPIGIVLMFPVPQWVAFWTICASGATAMIFGTMFTITMMTFLQQLTPAAILGKIMSLVYMMSICASPIGQAVYGVLFEYVPQGYIIVFVSVVLLIGIVVIAKKLWRKFPSIA